MYISWKFNNNINFFFSNRIYLPCEGLSWSKIHCAATQKYQRASVKPRLWGWCWIPVPEPKHCADLRSSETTVHSHTQEHQQRHTRNQNSARGNTKNENGRSAHADTRPNNQKNHSRHQTKPTDPKKEQNQLKCMTKLVFSWLYKPMP